MADKTSLNMNKFFGENYSQVNPSMGVNNSLQINPERIIKTVEKILEPAIQQVQEVSQENSNQNNILQKIVSSFESFKLHVVSKPCCIFVFLIFDEFI